MEIKQGSSNVPLFIKPRQDGIVIPMATWTNQYGEATPSNGVYTLVAETADKSGNLEIIAGSVDTDGMNFTLPAEMFDKAQRSWTVSLKFLLNGTTSFSLYNFDIKVTKSESPNSR